VENAGNRSALRNRNESLGESREPNPPLSTFRNPPLEKVEPKARQEPKAKQNYIFIYSRKLDKNILSDSGKLEYHHNNFCSTFPKSEILAPPFGKRWKRWRGRIV